MLSKIWAAHYKYHLMETIHYNILMCVFLQMREYYGGTASVAELYFSNENNESATRSEEEFVITHSH